MSLIWAVIEANRFKEDEAKKEVLRHGMRVLLPMMPVLRRMQGKVETVLVPRFSPYLFAEFDPDRDQWESLSYSGPAAVRPIKKVWCNHHGDPRPVPVRAIKAMQDYNPPSPAKPNDPTCYVTGQPVIVYLIPGKPQQGVFVEYERGKMKAEVWILGRPVIMSVPEGAIEPAEEILTKVAI